MSGLIFYYFRRWRYITKGIWPGLIKANYAKKLIRIFFYASVFINPAIQ